MREETLNALRSFMEDTLKLVYAEPPSEIHGLIIAKMVPWFLEKADLKAGKILDVGCGQGEALIEFGKRGFIACGVTAGAEDAAACREKGLIVWECDMHDIGSILKHGEYDAIWLRHSAEHSPVPFFLLLELKKLLKPEGWLYFEAPAPGTPCLHDIANQNHYSVFTDRAWIGLLSKAGFAVRENMTLDFETQAGPDRYYVMVARRVT